MKKRCLSIFGLCLIWTLCFSESFIIEEKPVKRRPDHQVKQEIASLMGRIAELESDAIKTKAELQKTLSVTIRSYLEGVPTKFFSNVSRKELQDTLGWLREQELLLSKGIEADRKALSFLVGNKK